MQRPLLLILTLTLIRAQDDKIEKLQKEEKDLYKKIRAAVNDTLELLKVSNDTDLIEGMTYLQQLQHDFATNVSRSPDNETENYRRQQEGNILSHLLVNKDRFDEVALKKQKIYDLNRQEVSKKLDAWLKKREMKKKKIGGVPDNHYGEKCPKTGTKGKGKKKKVYPCCKKCCKRSYLGCL